MTDGGIRPTPTIDSTVPHSARVWNYLLGGKDNYPVDRTLGDAILRASPGLADVARTSREFLGRAIRHLAGEVGIRQFLDIGTGLPTADNTSTPTSTTPTPSWPPRPGPWTSTGPSRSS